MKSMRIFVFIKRTFKNTPVFVEFSLQYSLPLFLCSLQLFPDDTDFIYIVHARVRTHGRILSFFSEKIADSLERGIYPPAFLHGVGDFFYSQQVSGDCFARV